MDEKQFKILKMIEKGTVTAEQGAKLLSDMNGESPARQTAIVRDGVPDPYRALITKETISMALGACQDVLKEHKGLEMVHVETADGTFVSITL